MIEAPQRRIALDRPAAEQPGEADAQLLLAVGLGDHRAAVESVPPGREMLGVAGDVEDLQIRPHLDRGAAERETVERSRHDDVGQQEIDRRIGLDQGERLVAVARGEHAVAERLDIAARHVAHVALVLDDQNRGAWHLGSLVGR
jgi:hypothetical protein